MVKKKKREKMTADAHKKVTTNMETVALYPKCLRDQTSKEESSCPFVRYIKDDTKCYYFDDKTGSCTNVDCIKDILVRQLSLVTQADVLLTTPLMANERMLTCLVKFDKDGKITKAILGKDANVSLEREATEEMYGAFIQNVLEELKEMREQAVASGSADGEKSNNP